MSDRSRASLLDLIERLGNKLPEPPILFCWLAFFVVVGSALGAAVGWSVQPLKPVAVTGPEGVSVTLVAAGAAIEPRSLLTAEGLYFIFSSMLRNFATMPALPLVFVSMLGIGLAEKFGLLAPIFVPKFMIVGMSPELTTAAYRIGDSVVNIVTPLNSYMLIVLAVLQRYRPAAGLGTLISLMVPYSLALGVAWTALLVAWHFTGLPLGLTAPLDFAPGG